MSEWVSTAIAAARLGVSERTILRRAQAGKLESRKETTTRGVVVVVALDCGEVPTGADIVPTGADTQTTLETPSNGAEVPTGADGADTTLTAHLLDENRFLRGVIEQLQRDGAETRASLREALKAMPKAITSGAAPMAVERTQAPSNGASGGSVAAASNGAQNALEGEESASYGALADWLENQME